MLKFAMQSGLVVTMAALLAACETPMLDKPAVTETDAVDTVEETVIEAQPKLASLVFTWDISQTNIISPPINVRTSAIAACKERGFDTGNMINLSISGTIAEAEFGCRGAD